MYICIYVYVYVFCIHMYIDVEIPVGFFRTTSIIAGGIVEVYDTVAVYEIWDDNVGNYRGPYSKP